MKISISNTVLTGTNKAPTVPRDLAGQPDDNQQIQQPLGEPVLKPSTRTKMKTLIMNNSVAFITETPGYDTSMALSLIVAENGQIITTRRGTTIEIVFEFDDGAARFGFATQDEFLFEALVLGTDQGRQCWAKFHSWCEHLFAENKARETKLASAVPDDNAWNCVIFYNSCDQLAAEDFDELILLQCRLAEAYVRHLDQTQAGGADQ